MATRKRRTAKQKAATAKMLAANRRRRNPVAGLALSNPRKRRRAAPRRRNPVISFSKPRRVRRRRNPITVNTASLKGLLMPAVFGAAGAVVVDAAMNYLPLPATLKTGTIGMVTKAGAALLLGTMGRKFIGPRATDMAVGSLTIQAYALMRQFLPASITGLGYVSPGLTSDAMPAIGANPAATSGVAGMGMYVGGNSYGLGEYVQ